MYVRKEGFYWIVFLPDCAEDWSIGEWFGNQWYAIGVEHAVDETNVLVGDYIGEARPFERNSSRDSGEKA